MRFIRGQNRPPTEDPHKGFWEKYMKMKQTTNDQSRLIVRSILIDRLLSTYPCSYIANYPHIFHIHRLCHPLRGPVKHLSLVFDFSICIPIENIYSSMYSQPFTQLLPWTCSYSFLTQRHYFYNTLLISEQVTKVSLNFSHCWVCYFILQARSADPGYLMSLRLYK